MPENWKSRSIKSLIKDLFSGIFRKMTAQEKAIYDEFKPGAVTPQFVQQYASEKVEEENLYDKNLKALRKEIQRLHDEYMYTDSNERPSMEITHKQLWMLFQTTEITSANYGLIRGMINNHLDSMDYYGVKITIKQKQKGAK